MLPGYVTEFVVLLGVFAVAGILTHGMSKQWWRSAKFAEGLTNAKFFFFDALLVLPLVGLVSVAIAAAVPQLAQIGLYELPIALEFVLAVFFSDLAGYLRHRLLHTPSWWPSHAVHHSDEHVHWLTLVRIHPIERVVSVVFNSVMLGVLGFGPDVIVANGLLRHYYGYLEHAEIHWTLGPLRYVFATPHFHRWHHSSDLNARDKNFAVIFSFIDVAFGTFYCPNERPASFGVAEMPRQCGFLELLAHPFAAWMRRARPSQSVSKKAA